jgi:assimilatory nitrate reductase catalytic subunit
MGIKDGDWVTAETRRGAMHAAGDGRDDDPPRHHLHSLPLAGRKSANQLTISAQDPISKIPEYKVCAARIRKADGPPEWAGRLEPQQG